MFKMLPRCLDTANVLFLLAIANPTYALVEPDRTIVVSTMVAQMKYDRSSFSVRPGEIIRIILKNPDDLPHNLVLCKPAKGNENDKGKEISDAVIALGERGVLQNWLPEKHPRVVGHTSMVNPKEEGSFTLIVPNKEGPYPYVCTFPGHAQLMNGVMIVSKNASPLNNLRYKLYHGNWDKLPEWSKLKPKKTGLLDNGFLSLSPKDRGNGFGILYEGKLDVPKDGTYEFFLASDDGSALFVAGNLVVVNDGLDGEVRKQGKVKLRKGLSDFRVGYFDKVGEEALYVGWKGPGFNEQPLSETKPKVKVKPRSVQMLVEPLPGEAVLYRNFIDRAGPRAIGVGYSEGINLAFDANVMRLAIIWRGKFIDGARHWNGRGQGFQAPAGEDPFHFPNGVAFSKLPSISSSWPPDATRASAIKFKGYRLDERQRPSFKYQIGKALITDFSKPGGTDGARFLVREITIEQNGENLDGLVFRAGREAVEQPDGYVLDQGIKCAIEGQDSVLVKNTGQPRADGDLRVPIKPKNGKVKITLTYSWI